MSGDRAVPTKRPGGAPTTEDDRPEGAGANPLSTGERAELHRQGAKAAARGESAAGNPLHRPENSPEATGESAQTWWQRITAWQRGHEAQSRTARRSPAIIPGNPITTATEPLHPAASPMTHIDPLLLASVRVSTFAGSRGLSNASGFFFRREERLYVVSSRHVFIDEVSGHLPDRMEIELHADASNLAHSSGLSMLLYRHGVADWRQGMDDAGEIDVAVLEIDRDALPDTVALAAFAPENLPRKGDAVPIGQPVLIPGFPLGFHDGLHHLPVVRQGIVASPYGWRFQGRGCFLTDARTHRGISGAPVVMPAPDRAPLPWVLLGIHSSRLDMGNRDVALDDTLGLNAAWYPDVLLTLTQT